MSNKAEESKYEMAAGAICPMPSCGSLAVAFRATQVRGLENIKPWEFTCPHCGVDFVVTDRPPHAERWYGDLVARFGNTHFAAEAMYWRAVAHYKATNDHTVLGKVAEELRTTYPSSVWAS